MRWVTRSSLVKFNVKHPFDATFVSKVRFAASVCCRAFFLGLPPPRLISSTDVGAAVTHNWGVDHWKYFSWLVPRMALNRYFSR